MIGWNKDQRQKCKDDRKTLFAVGLDDRPNPDGRLGAWEQTGLIDSDKAVMIFVFAQHLYNGVEPRKALDKAMEKPKKKARRQSLREGE